MIRYPTRRRFLTGSALALGTFIAPSFQGIPATAQNTTPDEMLKNAPHDTALKFHADGTPRPFAGNTVICHLPQQSKLRDAITRIHDDFVKHSFAHKLGILPPDSYHMTIYPGAEDQERNSWPADVPRNASMQECTRIVLERMKKFRLQCELPLRMRIDSEKTIGSPTAGALQLVGADEAEERKLRTLRDRLVEAFRFRDVDHDKYEFHIMLAYQLDQFTDKERSEYRSILQRRLPLIMAAYPILEWGIPEFCTFTDMSRFDIQLLLQT
jgi:hypothetical protein